MVKKVTIDKENNEENNEEILKMKKMRQNHSDVDKLTRGIVELVCALTHRQHLKDHPIIQCRCQSRLHEQEKLFAFDLIRKKHQQKRTKSRLRCT